MTTVREFAEQVLFADSLADKLAPPPGSGLLDLRRGGSLDAPSAPGRPEALRLSDRGVRVAFPGVAGIRDDRERGRLLHFFANHELLATELMALVLLKFPDAPAEFRAGVLKTLKEEQMHTKLYLRRMAACGVEFGELPVNGFFWNLVAPMATPLDYVTRLSLTFEQANLDYSKAFARVFSDAGDEETAAILERIHRDEIGHVHYGLEWFRQWKARGETDWEGYRRCLSFPLTPARAKGTAPFNAESRRLAGLDEDFIRHLEVCEVSRGRTPVVHWFNPSAESHARSAATGRRWQPDKVSLALEHDLEALMLACCRRDDAVLMRRPPSVGHLARLKAAGFDLPEIIPLSEIGAIPRKFAGLRPWAWSPDASETLVPFRDAIAPCMEHPWREPVPNEWFSKAIGLKLEQSLGPVPETGELRHDTGAVLAAIARHQAGGGQALLKAPFACSGRGHLRVNHDSVPAKTRGWIDNTLAAHGAVVVEPWLDRVLDFSALYDAKSGGVVELLGFTVMENDPAGRFQGIRVGPKFGTLLHRTDTSHFSPGTSHSREAVPALLFREARVLDLYGTQLPPLLAELLPGYVGPLGVDAMVHRLKGSSPQSTQSPNFQSPATQSLALKPVVEVNVRFTMGRLAWEWMKRGGNRPSRLRLLRKAAMSPEEIDALTDGPGFILNDPGQAGQFLAHWG